jgi:nicotinamidase-related amidase
LTIPENSALLVVDVQRGFDDPYWGARNNPGAEARIGRLLAAWRAAGWPVLHAQHLSTNPASPLHPDRPGCELHPLAAPVGGEPVFRKTVNSAFIGTDLATYLAESAIRTLVVVGLTTPHCVSTTVRMAANLGFEVFVVADATAAFDLVGHDGRCFAAADVHDLTLASLHGEFATVVTGDAVLADLAQ